MKYKFFKILVTGAMSGEVEQNVFIVQHRINLIDRYFIADVINRFLSICITWVDNNGALAKKLPQRNNKMDFQEVLNEADFIRYAKLCDLRQELAERENYPIYTLFTNKPLAAIVQRSIISKSALLAVKGLSFRRASKQQGHRYASNDCGRFMNACRLVVWFQDEQQKLALSFR